MEKSPRNRKLVFERIKGMIEPHMTGIDLGCGHGQRASEFAKLCKSVTGIDKQAKCKFADDFNYQSRQVEDWIDYLTLDDRWDFLHSRLLIQFLNKEIGHDLLEKIASHTNPGGFVYILTFFADPDNNHPLKCTSHYTIESIVQHFPGWKIIWAEQYLHWGPAHLVEGEFIYSHSEFLAVKPS